MTTKELFLQSWKAEAATTLRVLNAVPAAMLDYRPDPRSRTGLELAVHNALHASLILSLLEKGQIGAGGDGAPPATVSEAVAAFSAPLPRIEKQLRDIDEKTWTQKVGRLLGPDGQVIMSAPYESLAWSMLFDLIHHRGQLATYLRPMGGKVPSIYGPSADDAGRR
jgi:uncharacterized damage-inducible protein DinB